MKKHYVFGNNYQIKDDFNYTYSYAAKTHTEFDTEENCVVNRYNKALAGEQYPYDYISVLTKEKYGNVTATTDCSFESFGAPLIVFSDDIREENGERYYGVHFEVVAYENGLNVWYILPGADKKSIEPTLIASLEFPVEENKTHTLRVTVKDKTIFAEMNGQTLQVSHDAIPETFYIGITACEQVNRFYSFTVEN
jgi:hypothetical protein